MSNILWLTSLLIVLLVNDAGGFELTSQVQTTQGLVNNFAEGYYACDIPGGDKRMCAQETQAFIALTAKGCKLHISEVVTFYCPVITAEPSPPGAPPATRPFVASVRPPPPRPPAPPPKLPEAPAAVDPAPAPIPRAIIPNDPSPAAKPAPPPPGNTAKPPVVIPWRQRVEQRLRQLVQCNNAVLADEMKVTGACDYQCSQVFDARRHRCEELYGVPTQTP